MTSHTEILKSWEYVGFTTEDPPAFENNEVTAGK